MAQRALALLEEQAAGYTSLTLPAHLQIQLEDKRKEVRALVERTSRSPRTVSSPLLPASPQGRTNSSPYITLELTAAPNPAPAGTPVTWTVVARNTGSAAAHHLALLRGTAMLGDEFNLPAGEACTFNFTQTYEKSGEYAESVRLFGAPQPCTASAILAVFAPPDFALSVTPSSLEARSDQQIEFTVNLRNTGDVDLNRVLLRLGRQVFEDPFDLPVGGEHSLVFTRTYTSDTIAYITAAAITPAGERLEREASAIVKVIAPQKPDRSPSLPEPTQAVARENPSAGQRNREDLSGLRSITLAPGVEMEFVRIPAGEFIMGSDKQKDPQASDDETPQHKIRLDEYWIGKTPVTNAQYAVFAKATNQKFALPKGKENHPVVNVSWNDAAVFCQWLSKLSGQQVRLPSEAEWEKAARGTNGRIYPWGDEWDAKKCNSRDSGIRNTTPVGKFSPAGDSPYGCVDMAGNVWEWVADWYDGHYSAISSVSSPVGPQSGNSRVMRGGAWDGDVAYIRSASRYYLTPTNRYDLLGFRCVAASP
jgi:formylglycine-generating enzyme required for sulfatase activity